MNYELSYVFVHIFNLTTISQNIAVHVNVIMMWVTGSDEELTSEMKPGLIPWFLS